MRELRLFFEQLCAAGERDRTGLPDEHVDVARAGAELFDDLERSGDGALIRRILRDWAAL